MLLNMKNNFAAAAVISGEYEFLYTEIRKLGIEPIQTQKNRYIQKFVGFHPDMQMLDLYGRTFVLGGGVGIGEKLSEYGRHVTYTDIPKPEYPKDILCNAKLVGDNLFCNTKYIDKGVLHYCKEKKINVVHVNQGYAGCSICKVSDHAIITADRHIAVKASEVGCKALKVDNSEISLPGYNCGFIGGCAGLVAPGVLLFAGRLELYSYGQDIYELCKDCNVEIIELYDGAPLDVGGIIPIYV